MSTTMPIRAVASREPLSVPTREPRLHVRLLKLARQIHLYLGLFSAPAILFFALSGALQTFSLHQAKKGNDYKPANWIAVMAELHKNQTTQLPVRKQQPSATASASKPDADGVLKGSAQAAAPKTSTSLPMRGEGAPKHNALPLKIFFLIISLSLFVSLSTGVYMSYKYSRNKILVAGSLIAGFLVPTLLTFL